MLNELALNMAKKSIIFVKCHSRVDTKLVESRIPDKRHAKLRFTIKIHNRTDLLSSLKITTLLNDTRLSPEQYGAVRTTEFAFDF